MNFQEFRARDRALHVVYHEAKRRGGSIEASEEGQEGLSLAMIEEAQEALYQDHARTYFVSSRLSVEIRVWRHAVVVLAHRDDADYYLPELWQMTASELRIAADIREMAQRYEDGEIDELPPSGPWRPSVGA